jgi:hypothetical protein
MPPRPKKRKRSRVAPHESVGGGGDVVVSTIQLPSTFDPKEITLDTRRERLLFTIYGFTRAIYGFTRDMSLGIYDLNTGLTTQSGGYPWRLHGVSTPPNSDTAWISADNCLALVKLDWSGGVELTVGSNSEAGYVEGKFTDARFKSVSEPLCSLDGKSVYVCDRLNRRVRRLNLVDGIVSTVVAFQDPMSVHGPSGVPKMLCFDRRQTPPESALYVATQNLLHRIQLPETVSDVFHYRIARAAGARVMSALLRDLWYIVASYLAESAPSLSVVAGDHCTLVVAMLPSYDLLVSNDDQCILAVLDTQTGDKRLIAGRPGISGVRDGPADAALLPEFSSLALDETRRCVYLPGNGVIRRVSLPFQFFVSPPQFVSP